MITEEELKTIKEYTSIFKSNANSELDVPRSILKADLKKAVELLEKLISEVSK